MGRKPRPQARKRTSKQSVWKALVLHYKAISNLHLRQLFADDLKRGQRMALGTGCCHNRCLNACRTRLWLNSSIPNHSAGWSLFYEHSVLRKVCFGTSIPSISGAWNSAKFWRSAFFQNSKIPPNPCSATIVRPTL